MKDRDSTSTVREDSHVDYATRSGRSERRMSVTEAARNFADLVNRTYYQGESTLLLRSDEPVAMVVPVGGASVLGRDWIDRWEGIPHLDPGDAEEFGNTIEGARNHLETLKSPWD
jgi:antitoxin (DNA-binding transcriptional repressor) of toxin-antitoxin stability system